MRNVVVFLATLGGLGRVRWAPGTWGSLVGLLGGVATLHWFNWPWGVLITILVVKFIVCALICTAAEQALGVHDAPAIILDEAWAMAAILVLMPRIASSWPLSLFAFLLFRAFDVIKPPPLKRLARLSAGWGIMADDLGAASYTILVLWVVNRFAGSL